MVPLEVSDDPLVVAMLPGLDVLVVIGLRGADDDEDVPDVFCCNLRRLGWYL